MKGGQLTHLELESILRASESMISPARSSQLLDTSLLREQQRQNHAGHNWTTLEGNPEDQPEPIGDSSRSTTTGRSSTRSWWCRRNENPSTGAPRERLLAILAAAIELSTEDEEDDTLFGERNSETSSY